MEVTEKKKHFIWFDYFNLFSFIKNIRKKIFHNKWKKLFNNITTTAAIIIIISLPPNYF